MVNTTETINPFSEQPSVRDLSWVNHFQQLGSDFSSDVSPQPLEGLRLVSANHQAAQLIDLSPAALSDPYLLSICQGEHLLNDQQPIATVYSGHQFGHWAGQLGDGRACLLGQTQNAAGDLWELQLKGSGLTPYSRQGDGRAVLRSTIREYLCAEAMQGLGIATTRSLAMFDASAQAIRETYEPCALLIRMAPTHIRFGHFEHFASLNQPDHVKKLADFCLEHHFQPCLNAANPYLAMFDAIIDKTAAMIAGWQSVGFCHGVMNTDNMSILGLTIDYGPFGFMDNYHPNHVCNHSDTHARYAFNQQPNVALWNLSCLASALLSLFKVDEAKASLARFSTIYQAYYEKRMRAKLGLNMPTEQAPLAQKVANKYHQLLADQKQDFANSWRSLNQLDANDSQTWEQWLTRFQHSRPARDWLTEYVALHEYSQFDQAARIQCLNQHNPKYVLRNYLAQIAIQQAQEGDYRIVEQLLNILLAPYDEHPEADQLAGDPPDWSQKICVSCSS